MSTVVNDVSYPEFREHFAWTQGEHMTVIGPTQSGKSTLMFDLLPLRRFQLVIATKPQDPIIEKLRKRGYKIAREWPVPPLHEKVVFWPSIARLGDKASQREAIRRCLSNVYAVGGWCVAIDECRYVTDTLGLSHDVELFWHQGATLGISLVIGAQRPRHIPLLAYDQAAHLFFYRENDDDNLRRIGSMGVISNRLIRETVANLDRKENYREVLYANTLNGDLYRIRIDRKDIVR